MIKRENLKLTSGFAPSIIIFIIITIFSFANILEKPEMMIYDLLFKSKCKNPTNINEISIIAIDDNSINYLKNHKGVSWPWTRDVYYPMLKFLQYSGVKAVVFDIDFFDLRDDAGVGEDLQFAQALGLNKKTFLTAKLKESEDFKEQKEADIEIALDKNGSYQIDGLIGAKFRSYSHIQYPPQIFQTAANGFGFTNITFDKDGTIRKYNLFNLYKNRIVPSLAIETFSELTSTKNFRFEKDYLVYNNNNKIQLTDGQMHINWYGSGLQAKLNGKESVFQYYPFYYVAEAGIDLITGKTPRLSKDEFSDKIVFIGGVSANLFDFKRTSISMSSRMDPGVEIHATVLANLLRSDFIKRVESTSSVNIFVGLFTAIFLSFIFLFSKSMIRSSLLIIGYFIILISVYWFSFFRWNVYIDVVHLISIFVLSYFATLSFNYLAVRKSKDDIKKMFRHYVDPSILDKLLENPDNLKIGGERREITILFSDIKGFTTISESLSPEALIEYLNQYLGEMSDIIVKNRGCIDKFIGDAIMAFFGAPFHFEEHPFFACKSAIESQQKLGLMRIDFVKRGLPPPYARIGINTGIATVGNVGSDLTKEKRYNYTAIGDSVNLSSRLEGTNKLFGTKIMIGENTFKHVKEQVATRYIDKVRVVGKNEPVKIYELISLKDETPLITQKIIPIYDEAILNFQKREWTLASELFSEILKIDSNDGPTLEYLTRLNKFKITPPPDDWDGVFEMTSK